MQKCLESLEETYALMKNDPRVVSDEEFFKALGEVKVLLANARKVVSNEVTETLNSQVVPLEQIHENRKMESEKLNDMVKGASDTVEVFAAIKKLSSLF